MQMHGCGMNMMRENSIGLLGRVFICLILTAGGALAILNIWHGEVARPWLFSLILAGFLLFLVAKISLFAQGRWLSFGTH
ncbi:MAG: hypothetical protein ACTS5G_02585, partial [Burkholderiales bacterium]